MTGAAGESAIEEWRAHWKVIVPSFAGIMLVAGHAHALGVMIRPLEQEFGWPRAQISAGLMVISMVALIVSPLVGGAVDRLGARRIALFGVLVYCGAHAMLSLATSSIVVWWGLWVVLALANMMIMPVVWLAAINGYFFRSRGLAMAVALSGTGMAAAVFPILTNTLVESLGWRSAYLALGALSAGICFPLTWLLFKPAQQQTAAPSAATPTAWSSSRSQMASARYIKLAGASVIFAIASGALTVNIVPVLIAEGLTPGRAAATAGLLGIGSIIGRLCGGLLLDRFNGNIVAACSVLVPLIPATILIMTDQSMLWAGLACQVLGLSIGTEMDCCAYLSARHFGTRNFGALFGTINGLLLFGVGVAPFMANYIYDVTNSYDIALIGLIPLFVITAILFATLGRYPDLDREVAASRAST